MGLLRGLIWVFKTVIDRAEQELYDEEAVRAELLELYGRLEARAITDAEFRRREAELVQRLRDIEEYRQRKGQHASD